MTTLENIIDQCQWIFDRTWEFRDARRVDLADQIPDADFKRFSRLWDQAEYAGQCERTCPLSAKQRAFLDRMEAGVKRLVAGETYDPPEPRERQVEMFAGGNEMEIRS